MTRPAHRPIHAAAALACCCLAALSPPPAAGQEGLRTVAWERSGDQQLGGAFGVALSPDGQRLYVTASTEAAINTYRVDAATGALARVQGIGSLVFEGPVDIAISPDGISAYIAATVAGRVVQTPIDPATGGLQGVLSAPEPAAGGPLLGPSAVAVTPDDAQLLAIGDADPRLLVYERMAGGVLDVPTTFDLALAGARDLVLSADGAHGYITERNDDALLVFRRLAGGGIDAVQTLEQGVGGITGLDGPYGAALAPDGADLYVTAFDGETLMQLRRDPSTGMLTPGTTLAGATFGLVGAAGVVVTDDGRRVIVASTNPGSLAFFDRDEVTGTLAFDRLLTADDVPGQNLLGAAGLATRGDRLYATAGVSGAIVHLERRGPAFEAVAAQRDASPAIALPIAVLTSAVGDRVHVVGPEVPCPGGCIGWSLHQRDRLHGALTAISGGPFGPLVLPSFDRAAISEDGRHVYLASGFDDTVATAVVLPSGDLETTELHVDGVAGVDGLDGVRAVAVPRDGDHVYTASELDGEIARFLRDPTSGALAFLGTTPAAAGRALVAAPDGRQLYVAQDTQQLATFARDPATGGLTLIDIETEGVGGVTGLAAPVDLAFDGGGRHLYVISASMPPRVTVFARDGSDGTLAFVESQVGAAAMDTPSAVVVSRAGGHVVVGDIVRAALMVYRRDRSDGRLTFLHAIEGSAPATPPLLDVRTLALSADGRHLYAASPTTRTLLVFATDDLFADSFEIGTFEAWSGVVNPIPK